MASVLLATDAVGALVWGADIAAHGLALVQVVHSAAELEAALARGDAGDILLIDGPGLGARIHDVVARVRDAAPERSILAVPGAGERGGALAMAGADAVLLGVGEPEARALVMRQVLQAHDLRRELGRARYVVADPPVHCPATGTMTRAFAMAMLENLQLRGVRQGGMLSLVAVEADDQGALVDRYGPGTGVDIARELASRLREVVRAYDVITVLDERTVVVVLSPCDAVSAQSVASRLQLMSTLRPVHLGGDAVHLRCSVGLLTHDPRSGVRDAIELFDRVGEALVDARLLGGAQVITAAALSPVSLQRAAG